MQRRFGEPLGLFLVVADFAAQLGMKPQERELGLFAGGFGSRVRNVGERFSNVSWHLRHSTAQTPPCAPPTKWLRFAFIC